MKKEYFLLFVVGIIVLTAAALRIIQVTDKKEPVKIVESPATTSLPVAPSPIVPSPATSSPIDVLPEPVIEPIIEVSVSSPLPGDLVVSPLTVIGRARGGWFFEASLPVSLVDEDGNVIIAHYGQAESDWMTPDFVPFRSELVFETEAATGYLVIAKDNPSGLPENDDKIMIPVKFK